MAPYVAVLSSRSSRFEVLHFARGGGARPQGGWDLTAERPLSTARRQANGRQSRVRWARWGMLPRRPAMGPQHQGRRRRSSTVTRSR
uniref:Uncharacterized protein n=1 Tax=Setaria italica TaxID=4555 RepID=K3ZB95_SETIT